MCEPLSVAVYACESKAEVKDGYKVVVFGAGPVGNRKPRYVDILASCIVLLCVISWWEENCR